MSACGKMIGAPREIAGEESAARGLVPKALSNAANRLVDSLKINSTSEKVRRGRRVVIKRRNGYSEQLSEPIAVGDSRST